MKQTTIGSAVELSGIGLHTGQVRHVRLAPAPAGTGLVFRRTDVPEPVDLTGGDLVIEGLGGRTMLRRGALAVQTVEHLAAAAFGLGIDNLLVEVDGDEMPGLDGSALGYVEAIRGAGVVPLERERRVLRCEAALTVEESAKDGDFGASISVTPLERGRPLTVTYVLDYPGAPLAQGEGCFELTPETFAREIAPARTFCMASEVEALRAAGFGRGASHENTLVVDGDRAIENTLRFGDEPLRHKVLDLVGDMGLAGAAIEARVYARCSGHRLNRAILRKLQGDAEARTIRTEGEPMSLDVREIQEILPHRYPFLLVDRILDYTEGRRVVALKNVTANEPFFQGHFPGDPIMPGVLQIEAMAQAAGVLMMRELSSKDRSKLAVLMGLDKVKLRRPVVPGDQLVLEADSLRLRGAVGAVRARARVGGQIVAQAEIRFAVVDRAEAGVPRKAGD